MEISECTVFEFCQLLRACSAGARGADLLSRCLCFPVTSFGSQWGDHRMTGSRGWHPSAEPRSGSRTDQLGLPGKAQVRPPVESESRVSWAGRPAFVPRTTATCHGRTCPRVGNRVAPWCRTSRGTLEESAAPLVWVARVGSAAMSAGRGGWGTQARSLSLAPALRTAIGRVTVAFTRPACRGP
jgi:hypothetical protein